MQKFVILATAYTSKAMGEIDLKALRPNNAWRYRQDIFPEPSGFGVHVLAVTPEIIANPDGGNDVYTHRLKLTVYFPDTDPAANVKKYKQAIENRTRRFETTPDLDKIRKPVKPKPVSKPKAKKAEEPPKPEAPAKKTRGRGKKAE